MDAPTDVTDEVCLAARALRVDQVTGEVIAALRSAGVRPLLLKGPAISGWLYGQRGDLRGYVDSDLLVAPAERPRAEETLRALGFRRGRADWLEISRSWQRKSDVVDLHISLFGITVDARLAWPLLSSQTARITVFGRQIETLGIEARTTHLALHAAQHGLRAGGPLEDLERGLAQLDLSTWEAARSVARSVGAEGAFGAGLRLSERGREVADRLGVSTRPSAAVALRSGSPTPAALGFALFAESSGALARLRVIGRSLVPSRTYMRDSSALARRGRSGLVVAYLGRAAWLGLHGPSGYRAWRRARRDELAG